MTPEASRSWGGTESWKSSMTRPPPHWSKCGGAKETALAKKKRWWRVYLQWCQSVGHVGPLPDRSQDTGRREQRIFWKERGRRCGQDGGRGQMSKILNSRRKWWRLEKKRVKTIWLQYKKLLRLLLVKWKGEEKGKKVKEKTPTDLGPADTTIHTREGDPTVQLCGDSEVTCKWSMVNILWGRGTEKELAKYKKTLHP